MEVDESAKLVTEEIMPMPELTALLEDNKRSLDKNLEEFEPLRRLNDMISILNARIISGDVPLQDE